MENKAEIAIVGAGILGLAHAYTAARRRARGIVFERGLRATGASVRNFGPIWPIGQTHSAMHQLSLDRQACLSDRLGRSGRASPLMSNLLLATIALLVLGAGMLHGVRTRPMVMVAPVGFLMVGPFSFVAGARHERKVV